MVDLNLFNLSIDKDAKEILHEGDANFFVGIESVGGRLFLTKDTLIFHSNGITLSRVNKLTEIQLNEINRIKKHNFLGLITNGIKVYTNLKTYKFVVSNRKRWIEKINSVTH
jgi:hypothetical protein|tara:strand:+ start:221 stop:556 length:336 start_codon:yes stop_codon:yes gene_type:complete